MNRIPFRTVPLSHGYRWIRTAFDMYRHHPLMWIGYSVTIVLIGAAMSLVPFAGTLVFQLIAPVFNGGLMLACKAQQRGETLTFNQLFSAFNSHGARLVTIGGIYMTGMLIAFTLPALFSNDPLIHALLYSTHTTTPPPLATLHPSFAAALVLLFSLTLFTLMLMAYWFAPALVVLADFQALEAMKLSLSTCTANFAPFLLYGILMVVLLVVGSLPMLLGFLVVIPVGFISYFTAWEDLFDYSQSASSDLESASL